MAKPFLPVASVVIFASLLGACATSANKTDSSNGFVLRPEDELRQFEKVQIGMTADEVDAILGTPRWACADWRYYGHTPRIRPIDSPMSRSSIRIDMTDGVVGEKRYFPDWPCGRD